MLLVSILAVNLSGSAESLLKSTAWVPNLVSILLFAVLFLLKTKSTCKNKMFKTLHLRFYFACSCYALYKLVMHFFPLTISYLAEKALFIAAPQLLFTAIQYRFFNKPLHF